MDAKRKVFDVFTVLSLALLTTIVIVALRQVGLYHSLIMGADETGYFTAGFNLFRHGKLPGADYAPLYDFVYGFINVFTRNRNISYQVYRTLLALGLVYGFYFACRHRLPPWLSLVASVYWAMQSPYTFMFTIYIAGAFIGVLVLWGASKPKENLPVAMAMLALGAWVRPELLGAILIAVLVFWKDLRANPRRFLAFGIIFVAYLGYKIVVPPEFGNPGGRFYVAFCQHYGWTMNDFGWKGNNWLDCPEVMQRDFHGAATLFQIARANPHALWRHIAHNLTLAPWVLCQPLDPVNQSLSMRSANQWAWEVLPPLAFAKLLFDRKLVSFIRSIATELKLFALLSTSYLSWILIRPKPDYAIILAPFLVYFLVVMVYEAGKRKERPVVSSPRNATVGGTL